MLVLAAGTAGACWWLSGATGSAGAPTPPGGVALPSRVVLPAPGSGPAAGSVPAAGHESPQAAMVRLAEARAQAFRQVSDGPLTEVDEPGSPALDADRALVGRLRAAGIRLEGLSFAIAAVRTAAGTGGTLTLRATVAMSGYRQVATDSSRVVAAVPPSSPAAITLALVPAPDGRHWLVRQAWSSV